MVWFSVYELSPLYCGLNEVFSHKTKILVSSYAMINIISIYEFNFTLLIGCASLAKR